MKKQIAKSFDIFANKLVQFSQERGRVSWLIFLFILALTLVAITPLSWSFSAISQRGNRTNLSRRYFYRIARGMAN